MNYKEFSNCGFYPVGNYDFTFQYRGVELSVNLMGGWWYCRNITTNQVINLWRELPALDMAAQLRQWILETVPADRLREEGYHTLGWITSSVRHSLAQERAESIPFGGELDQADADDSIPAQYGL